MSEFAVHYEALAAQAAFRDVLDAFSYPGRILPTPATSLIPGLSVAASAVAQMLVDQETPVWFAARLAQAGTVAEMQLRTGCPVAIVTADATFAFTDDTFDDLAAFRPGDPYSPHDSATLVIDCASLDRGRSMTLAGPGIRSTITIAPSLSDRFWESWRRNADLYPLGVDVLLTSGDCLMGLPRTARLAVSRPEKN